MSKSGLDGKSAKDTASNTLDTDKDDRRISVTASTQKTYVVQASFLSLTPEPDCGYGWVIVASSFMIHCISIGLLSSFGVFQQAYTEVPEFAGSSAVAIAFIGSLGSAGLPLFSIMAGRLADKYTPCIVCSCGALIVLASLIIASFATEIWHLFIAQGFLLGMGASLTYIPGISIVSDWFIKRRGVAVGIAAAGAGAGGLILGPLLRALISKVGWRWTLRLIGVGGGGILLITYSIQHGLTREQGALLVGILNGASGVGRIVLGFVADYIGATNAITMCVTVATLLVFGLWPVATTFSTILAFVLLFGFFVGGSAALMRTVVAHLFGSKGNIPTITGLNYSSSLFGFVAGPPIVGALIDAYTTYTPDGVKHISYIPAIMFCGTCFSAGLFLIITLRWTVNKGKATAKI
ncbi:hypothetical protein BSLG_008476 [Batrachochytrium salamandrivorans]|nr:hypothetical protein BSLG_008476 [Batrachochytrium salamandrivorans]